MNKQRGTVQYLEIWLKHWGKGCGLLGDTVCSKELLCESLLLSYYLLSFPQIRLSYQLPWELLLCINVFIPSSSVTAVLSQPSMANSWLSLLNCWGETVVNRNQALPFSSYKSLLPLMNEALFPQGNPISLCFWWNLSLRTNLFFFFLFFPCCGVVGKSRR